jgi:ATP-dependent DNA helicase RecQ
VRRDFDHVAAFAEALGKALVIPVLKAVTKERATEPQKEFRTLAQKRRNVAGAFRADRTVAARRVLLIDDLFDSGATLGEIAQTMRRAGARAVLVLTMTRTIHSDG